LPEKGSKCGMSVEYSQENKPMTKHFFQKCPGGIQPKTSTRPLLCRAYQQRHKLKKI